MWQWEVYRTEVILQVTVTKQEYGPYLIEHQNKVRTGWYLSNHLQKPG